MILGWGNGNVARGVGAWRCTTSAAIPQSGPARAVQCPTGALIAARPRNAAPYTQPYVHRRGAHCAPVPICHVRNFPEKALLRWVGGRTLFAPTFSTGKNWKLTDKAAARAVWRQREIARGVGDAAPYGLLLQLRYTIVYHFLQMFTMILQFAAGNAIIGKKAREQLLNTQLFPFLRPMRTAPALRLARGAAN